MKRNLLIGLLVVLGIAVTVFNPVITGIFGVGVWIYLVRMVRKQKTGAFKDQMGQEIPKRHLKGLTALLVVAGVLFMVFVVASIVHNVSHGPADGEETVFFFIALVALAVFIAATAGGMAIFLKARQRPTQDASVSVP